MSDVELPADRRLEFRVMTDATFPHGLMCAHCGRLIAEGQPFESHETRLYDNGDTMAHLACAYCPCDEGLTGEGK